MCAPRFVSTIICLSFSRTKSRGTIEWLVMGEILHDWVIFRVQVQHRDLHVLHLVDAAHLAVEIKDAVEIVKFLGNGIIELESWLAAECLFWLKWRYLGRVDTCPWPDWSSRYSYTSSFGNTGWWFHRRSFCPFRRFCSCTPASQKGWLLKLQLLLGDLSSEPNI